MLIKKFNVARVPDGSDTAVCTCYAQRGSFSSRYISIVNNYKIIYAHTEYYANERKPRRYDDKNYTNAAV